ncbi:MAG: hypothetical protein JNL98_06875 [Bryobacterales bacterium]|nr:hypothetical protein [Bryobacterales bacterium]
MTAKMEDFFDSVQTVPKMLSDLALAVSTAQGRLDDDYVCNLKEFVAMLSTLRETGLSTDQLLALIQGLAPARLQFTETTVEVRADLQMSSLSELGVSGELGVRAGMFAVALNASYTRRYGYDQRAAATIRSVIQAAPPAPGVMEQLLRPAVAPPGGILPSTARYRELAEVLRELQTTLAPRDATPQDGERAREEGK